MQRVVDVRVRRIVALHAPRRARVIARVVASYDEPRLPLYLALDDADVLASYAPNVVLRVRIEARTDTEPAPLAADEQAEQRAPTDAEGAAPADDGRAPVYRTREALDVVGRADAVTYAALRPYLPSAHRVAMTAALRREPRPACAADALAALARAGPSLAARETALLRRVVTDAFGHWEPLLLAARGVVTPSSLGRAPADGDAVLALDEYVHRHAADDVDAARFVGRYAHLMPINVTRTRHPFAVRERDTSTFAVALAGANARRSTVVRLALDDVPTAALRHRVLTPLDGETYAIVRDREFELDIAAFARERPLTLVEFAGEPVHAFAALARRYAADAVYVVPTVGHAAAAATLGALSVDDVIGGRVPPDAVVGRPLVVLFAHAFGVDSLATTLRTLGTDAADVALVGDPYNGDGSPRCNDRGAPFRDLCTVARRHTLATLRVEQLLGRSLVTALGPFSPDEHRVLRSRTPSLDGTSVHRVDALTDVDTPALVVVGDVRRTEARRVVGDASRAYVVVPCLGQLTRVRGVSVRGEPAHDVHAYGALVDVESHASIDHRHCCFTDAPTRLEPAAHACFAEVTAPLARDLARVVARPVAADVALVLTDASCAADVLAAAALTRSSRRLFIVGTAADLAAALARPSRGARTTLVDALTGAALATPRPALVADVPPLPAGATTALAFVGATTAASAQARTAVTTLRRAFTAYIDDVPTELSGRVPAAAVRGAADERYATFVPFEPADVDDALLAAYTERTLFTHLYARLMALFAVHDDLPQARTESFFDKWAAFNDYPPVFDEPATSRRREATLVHLLCTIVKPVPTARAWYIEAEARFMAARTDADDDGERHRAALTAYLADDVRVPAIDFTSDNSGTLFTVFGELRARLAASDE